MKSVLAATLFSMFTASAALAQSAPEDTQQPLPPPPPAQPVQVQPLQQPAVAQTAPLPLAPVAQTDDEDNGWHRPAGQRFTSGFRMGGMYIANWEKQNRMNEDGTVTSIKDKFGLKSPYMFLLGYEGFYRIVGHSWLNVLMVGNVSVAGLDQSKFIPTASGLLGFEIDRQLELGVGVNVTPDPVAPSHMIAAAGWTPKVGSIQTPIHFFYIPDADGNSRTGATIGMNW
jgi:hypothetical protein